MSKRTAEKQITKDNADYSDSSSESEVQKSREKASEEVLATRKIVSVRRGGAAKPPAPKSAEDAKSPKGSPKKSPVGGLFAGMSTMTSHAGGEGSPKQSLFSGLSGLASKAPESPKQSLFSGLTGLASQTGSSPKKEISGGLFGSLFSAAAPGEGLFSSSFSFSAVPGGEAFPSFGGGDSKQGTPEDSVSEEEEEETEQPAVAQSDELEGEEQVYQTDCKLYKLTKEDEGSMKWVEKCIGFVRLLRTKETGQLRLVVRMKGVYRLALNVALVASLCKAEKVGNKSVRFNGVDESNALGMFRLNLITEDQQAAFLGILPGELKL